MKKLTLLQRVFINVKYYILFFYWFLTDSKRRHEWRRWWLVVFLFFLSACSPVWEEIEKSSLELGSGKEKTSLSTTTPENKLSTTVTAELALRLRDLPENQGGYELTTMPNGSVFTVSYCRDFGGTLWAYGSYVDGSGKNWIGFTAARYLSGGCE